MDNRREMRVWSGEYRGVPYEINKFNISSFGDAWTFYLFLREKQFPDIFESIWIDDYKSGIGKYYFYHHNDTLIGNLDWHGGCTYYRKVSGFDHEQRVIKVGCDYQHYFDEGQHYNIEIIEMDVVSCINSLYDVAKVLQWCAYCGDFVEHVSERRYCDKCEKEH